MLIYDYTKPPLKRQFAAHRDFFKGKGNCKIILTETQCSRLREELVGGFFDMYNRNIIGEVLKENESS